MNIVMDEANSQQQIYKKSREDASTVDTYSWRTGAYLNETELVQSTRQAQTHDWSDPWLIPNRQKLD